MVAREWACTLLLAASLVATPARAATVDIVPYFGLTPGHWAIYEKGSGATLEHSARVVSRDASGRILETWYDWKGGAWVFDGIEIFRVTSTELRYLGSSDGTQEWLFDSPLKLPRVMTVGRPVFVEGMLRDPITQATQRHSVMFTVTKIGLTVTAPTGTFSGCIKTRMYSFGNGESRDSVGLSCRGGRSAIKGWYTKIRDTADPQVQEVYASPPSQLIQSGTSNPPIP